MPPQHKKHHIDTHEPEDHQYKARETIDMSEQAFRLGDGNISGYTACGLGILSFLAVICYLLFVPKLPHHYRLAPSLRWRDPTACTYDRDMGITWFRLADPGAHCFGCDIHLS